MLTKAVFRRAKVAFDNAHDLDSVLHLFERAVKSNMADTDVYCDAIESCINSRRYKVGFRRLPLSTYSLLHLHVLHLLSQHQNCCDSTTSVSDCRCMHVAMAHALACRCSGKVLASTQIWSN